jgi:copper resistance protein D
MNVAFAFAVGSALLGAWLARDAQAAVAPGRPAWLRAQRSTTIAVLVLLLTDLAWLLYETASMAAVPLSAAFSQVPVVLTQTHVGLGWSVAFGGALVLLLVSLSHGTGALRNGVLWLAVLVIAAGKASLGHAADAGFASAAFGMHTLHILTTAVWAGLVLASGLSVLSALGMSVARGVLIRVAGRISGTSLVAFLLVIVTGVFNAWRGSGGSLDAIAVSNWGHVLMLKAVLVALAVVLGGLNRLSVLPRLRRTASTVDAHTFTNLLYLEALVMIGIFVAAAALAHSIPASAAIGG